MVRWYVCWVALPSACRQMPRCGCGLSSGRHTNTAGAVPHDSSVSHTRLPPCYLNCLTGQNIRLTDTLPAREAELVAVVKEARGRCLITGIIDTTALPSDLPWSAGASLGCPPDGAYAPPPSCSKHRGKHCPGSHVYTQFWSCLRLDVLRVDPACIYKR